MAINSPIMRISLENIVNNLSQGLARDFNGAPLSYAYIKDFCQNNDTVQDICSLHGTYTRLAHKIDTMKQLNQQIFALIIDKWTGIKNILLGSMWQLYIRNYTKKHHVAPPLNNKNTISQAMDFGIEALQPFFPDLNKNKWYKHQYIADYNNILTWLYTNIVDKVGDRKTIDTGGVHVTLDFEDANKTISETYIMHVAAWIKKVVLRRELSGEPNNLVKFMKLFEDDSLFYTIYSNVKFNRNSFVLPFLNTFTDTIISTYSKKKTRIAQQNAPPNPIDITNFDPVKNKCLELAEEKDRLEDEIGEKETQIQLLEEQVAKYKIHHAQQYIKLNKYQHSINEYQQQIAAMTTSLTDKIQMIQDKDKLIQLYSNIANNNGDLQSYKDQLQVANEELYLVSLEINDLQQDIVIQKNENKKLQQDIKMEKNANKKLGEYMKQIHQKLKDNNIEIEFTPK